MSEDAKATSCFSSALHRRIFGRVSHAEYRRRGGNGQIRRFGSRPNSSRKRQEWYVLLTSSSLEANGHSHAWKIASSLPASLGKLERGQLVDVRQNVRVQELLWRRSGKKR